MDLNKVRSILSSGDMDRNKSDFQVFRRCNVGYKLRPMRRELAYSEFRISPKSEYACQEEFLVRSVIKEEFGKESNIVVAWEHLDTRECSTSDLQAYYSEIYGNVSNLPQISDVVSSVLIDTQSDFNWLFLEDSDNYLSLFWLETTRQLFKRSA